MLQGYRTVLFNVIMGTLLLIRAAVPGADVPTEGEVGGMLDSLIGHADAIILLIGNLILRYFTKTAIFKAGK
jgi:hypothetical protein